MRPIKFRAWDKKRRVMKCALGVDPRSNQVIVLLLPDEGAGQTGMDDDDCILMQFTGLLDKNGKEIYEGDIFAMFSDTQRSQVVFNEGMFSVFCRESGGQEEVSEALLSNVLDIGEVIGNIYENPELLK